MSITDTPAFRRWFGDSKVVDAKGKPMMVYHGTNADFSEFSLEYTPERGGILAFFSKSPKFASQYAQQGDGLNVMPVYLKVENPFDYRKEGKSVASQFYYQTGGILDTYEINRIKQGLGEKIDDPEKDTGPLKRSQFVQAVSEGSWDALEAPEFVVWLRRLGYDGIITKEGNAINYAIFDPTQVKSAYGNRGTFDPNDPDIRNPRHAPPQFPYQYAAYLKSKFPDIWRAGGNIRGNDAFRWWTAYRRGDRSPTVMRWWTVTRPAWIARHYQDHRLPGVVAQIKWGTVGKLGVAGMKKVVEDAIRRRYA